MEKQLLFNTLTTLFLLMSTIEKLWNSDAAEGLVRLLHWIMFL